MKDPTRRDSDVRVVVEVDGKPIGFLQLEVDRLWPLIDHHKRESHPVEWMDRGKFDSVLQAAAAKRLVSRLAKHLYGTLGDEIVKTQLDIEAFRLKAEAAAQIFGHTKAEIEKLTSDSGRTPEDFAAFFWDYLLDDRGTNVDLKKEWKAARSKPQ